MHKPNLKNVNLWCISWRNACMGRLPHTCVVPAFYSKKQKIKQARALPTWTPQSLNLIIITSSSSNYFLYLFIYLFTQLFIFKHNSSKAKAKMKCKHSYTWAKWARPAGPAQARWVLARPWTLLDRAWADIPLPRKNFLGPSPVRNTAFCYFTLWNVRAARLGPDPVQKIRHDLSSETVMDGTFSAQNNRAFFRPGPQNVQV